MPPLCVFFGLTVRPFFLRNFSWSLNASVPRDAFRWQCLARHWTYRLFYLVLLFAPCDRGVCGPLGWVLPCLLCIFTSGLAFATWPDNIGACLELSLPLMALHRTVPPTIYPSVMPWRIVYLSGNLSAAPAVSGPPG